jgi:hypothetical protein
MSVQIVEGPGYAPDGKGGIVLLGEYGRDVTVTCGSCCITKQLRLCSDKVLADIVCDTHLDEHLRRLGWSVGIPKFDDVCPKCTQEAGF